MSKPWYDPDECIRFLEAQHVETMSAGTLCVSCNAPFPCEPRRAASIIRELQARLLKAEHPPCPSCLQMMPFPPVCYHWYHPPHPSPLEILDRTWKRARESGGKPARFLVGRPFFQRYLGCLSLSSTERGGVRFAEYNGLPVTIDESVPDDTAWVIVETIVETR